MSDESKRYPVLMFHGIGQPGHAMEPDEELYWISWDFFNEILDFFADEWPGDVEFTFDDGNASDLPAARKMREKGISGSFFVLAGRVGEPGYLTADEVRELRDLGMEVGLHGRDHVDWRKIDDRQLESEVVEARAELAELVGKPIRSLAIPYGLYDRRVRNYLAAADFERIYTSDKGLASRSQQIRRRNPIMERQDMADIRALARGEASMSDRLRRTIMPRVKALI